MGANSNYATGCNDPLLKLLMDNNIVPKHNVAMVLIDINARSITKIYVEQYLDYSALQLPEFDLLKWADGIEIKTKL